MQKKINEIRNFAYTLDYIHTPINKIINSILNFLYDKYHNDDYNSPKFNPIIKGLNFDYTYDYDTASLYVKYRLTRRKWLNLNFENLNY
jgi:hypothetical protein